MAFWVRELLGYLAGTGVVCLGICLWAWLWPVR